jgi:hypothetical protein
MTGPDHKNLLPGAAFESDEQDEMLTEEPGEPSAVLFDPAISFDQLAFSDDEMGGEAREYGLRGCLTPENWQRALDYINSLGLHTDLIESPDRSGPLAEAKSNYRVLSHRSDFSEFAQRSGYSEVLAGMAWTKLARRFEMKTRPIYYSRHPWYRSLSKDDDFPDDLFAEYPADSEEMILSSEYRSKFSGLRLAVLDELLARVEQKLSQSGAREAIAKVLGSGVGTAQYEFLKEFSADKHRQIEAAA